MVSKYKPQSRLRGSDIREVYCKRLTLIQEEHCHCAQTKLPWSSSLHSGQRTKMHKDAYCTTVCGSEFPHPL